MGVAFVDNEAQHRYELRLDDELVAIELYTLSGDTIAFDHTETLPAERGGGVARQLVESAFADARRRRLGVLPCCPYVAHFLATHPADADLVPADRRSEFGLPPEAPDPR
jgi:predicted GNAT family acetyltransferase